MSRQNICCLAFPCSFHLPFVSYFDVAQAQELFCIHCTVLIGWFRISSAALIVCDYQYMELPRTYLCDRRNWGNVGTAG